MKRCAILFLLLCSITANAQHYVRTKHNIGIAASYGFADNTTEQWSTKSVKPGSTFSAGLTRSYADILYPEIFFTQHISEFPLSNEQGVVPYKWNAIGAGLMTKFDLFSIDNRKRNGYCFGREINLDLGMDYTHGLNLSKKQEGFSQHDEIGAKAGIGMYSVWGGSAKGHEAWTIHWEAYYRYGLTPFMQNNGTDFTHSSFNIGLRLMHYKTYRFSEM